MRLLFLAIFFILFLTPFFSFSQQQERVRIITNNGGRYEGIVIGRYDTYIRLRTEDQGDISILNAAIHSEWPLVDEVKLDSGKVFVQMKDGNTFIGKVLEESEDQIKLETNIGVLTLAKSSIESIGINENVLKYGKEWIANLNSTRYFFSPNSRSLEPGTGYYQNFMLVGNQVAIGVTKNFSLGVGLVPTFFFGTSEVPIWITPRVNFTIVEDKLSVGGGGLFGTVVGYGESFGIYYANVTFGSADQNFSGGFGRSLDGTPTITISGMLRTGPKFYLMSELLFVDEVFAGFFGGRSLLKSISLDYGIVLIADSFTFVGVPFLSLTVPFGG